MATSEGKKTKELLPCPFCGSKAILQTNIGIVHSEIWWTGKKFDGTTERLDYQIQCSKCRSYVGTPLTQTRDEAIKIWNRRQVNL